MPDEMSQEKIAPLRAYGAEVVITPTAVDHESPGSYYSVADRLAEEVPGAFKPDQYSNEANPQAHYETTGPELSGADPAARWTRSSSRSVPVRLRGSAGLRRRRPGDPDRRGGSGGTSVTADADHPEHPYLVEGIGKDTWPVTLDPSVVDEWIRVSDRDSFLTARRLAREEGLLVGGSCGLDRVGRARRSRGASGPDATDPDDASRTAGRSYLSKFYDDNWMIQYGFMERRVAAADGRRGAPLQARARRASCPELVTIDRRTRRSASAIDLMQRYGDLAAARRARTATADSLTDIDRLAPGARACSTGSSRTPTRCNEDVAVAMQPPLAAVDVGASLDEVFAELTGPGARRRRRRRQARPVAILTRSDLLEFLAAQRDAGRDVGLVREARRRRTLFAARRRDRDRADDQRARRRASPARVARRGSAAPSATATSGFTYCVRRRPARSARCRAARRTRVKPMTEPMTVR